MYITVCIHRHQRAWDLIYMSNLQSIGNNCSVCDVICLYTKNKELHSVNIVFVAGIDRTENRAGCITVGVLLHYLILVAWMWMGAEAVLLFQKLVIVFKKSTTIYIVVVSIVCWGKQYHYVIVTF